MNPGNAEPQLGTVPKAAELGLGVPGHAFWMRDYWDRYIRHERRLESVIHYIHENPVKAGLCQTAQDWPFSSAKLQA
ncbi:hypothetical protein [Polaromonas naphthalenivorans]|uniref:Transposase IS200-like domain-containing protein n=1 Tax=Polaromonas naphthalenivorans (strain CJ2) TaxID=365044 RepID=A1VRP7_POLNA|nr:hypothetical protein [Polaromonas naphthalenivorans]ABM38325.1 hypothetical protein Pnap_3026 [Polaromonas naphthalenivorans CJ2]